MIPPYLKKRSASYQYAHHNEQGGVGVQTVKDLTPWAGIHFQDLSVNGRQQGVDRTIRNGPKQPQDNDPPLGGAGPHQSQHTHLLDLIIVHSLLQLR